MKVNKKKKAFTLTELLVVVIIIGVLSAVVLPKFNKIIETRKTTEAEELMAAVRTEQEKRCALDKPYLAEAEQLADILPSSSTKNFDYSFTNTGMIASSKGKYGYELKMPSYADGRICCENETECLKLNKDYPLCSELIAKTDYDDGTACEAAETVSGEEPTCSKSSYEESCPAGQTGKIIYTVNSECEYEVTNTCEAEILPPSGGCTFGEWKEAKNAPYSVWNSVSGSSSACPANPTSSCTQYERFGETWISTSVAGTSETTDTCDGTGAAFNCDGISGNYYHCIDKRMSGYWDLGKTVYFDCSSAPGGYSTTIDWSVSGISFSGRSCSKTGYTQEVAQSMCDRYGKEGYVCYQGAVSTPSVNCNLYKVQINGKWYVKDTSIGLVKCGAPEMKSITCERRTNYRYRSVTCD